MRIGTNHGSLSDRIMNRFGDTPAGMVESAVEFARIARKYGYHDFVFSMKSSNPKVMINAYRMLAARLLELGPDWNYPLHLGVTEAGDGEDGRIKSAIGIGALLADGLGDTIRVSLTEDSVHEIPVARALVALAKNHAKDELPPQQPPLSFDPFVFARRASEHIAAQRASRRRRHPFHPRRRHPGHLRRHRAQARFSSAISSPTSSSRRNRSSRSTRRRQARSSSSPTRRGSHLVTIKDGCTLSPIVAYRYLAAQIPGEASHFAQGHLHPPEVGAKPDVLDTMLSAAVQHRRAALRRHRRRHPRPRRTRPRCQRPARVQHPAIGRQPHLQDRLRRVSQSCGRTLFNLQSTTAKIRESTNHLKGVKIAIMGCIVNGPGEMADADFGYVGGAPGKVNLYIGKTPVKFNIPEGEAVARLVDLIKENGKWVDAPVPVAAS